MQRREFAGKVKGRVQATDGDVQVVIVGILLEDLDGRARQLRHRDVIDLKGIVPLADTNVGHEGLAVDGLLQ